MPSIPFPNVPAYPGVPQLNRPASAAVASVPALAIGIGTVGGILANALQQSPQWGIFDHLGNQLGVNSSGNSIVSAISSQLLGGSTPSLSTVSLDYTKEMKSANFPVEGGRFAKYNKVEMPANPVVSLALDGSEYDRTSFLAALDAACKSTNGYNVVTPTVTYANYSIDRYTYQRRATRGAVLIIVDVALDEIRTVSASFSQVSPIQQPQDANATPQVNNGSTQAGPPDQSTFLSFSNFLTGVN